MYITDIKKEFYEFLIGKRIVILVHYDIDALCTCRILQTLIKYDSIQYSLIPVRGLDELKTAYRENYEQINIFILINCGGSIDLVEFLDPVESSIFFVLDTHKPTDVCNIYSDAQIRLLWQQEDDQNVPNFEDIFNEDEEEEQKDLHDDDDDDNDEEDASKRRRLGEEDILKRREKRLWEEKRNKLMFEYSQYTYYSKASAITFFKLAHTLAKDSKELLWLTIVALSSQQVLGQIESSQYIVLAQNVQLEVARLNQRHNATENTTSTLSISVEQDIKLPLFRHWSIEKAITCSVYLGTKLKLWTRRGERKMQELFADMGLPLAQTKQLFTAMELTYRKEFITQLEKCVEKFGLSDLMYPSFMAKFGYRLRYGASDMVYILVAVLEQMVISGDAAFSDTLDCLAKPLPVHLITGGLEQAKVTLETCQKIMKAALDQKKIFSAGPFLYFIVHETTTTSHIFSKPHTLLLLARYIQHAYCERQGGRTSANAMPLVISAPIVDPTLGHTESSGQVKSEKKVTLPDNKVTEPMCLLLGLPPLCENSPKSFFGKAFEQVAERTHSVFSANYFDTSYCELRIGDRTRFLDSLTALLS